MNTHKGDKIKRRCITRAFLGGRKCRELHLFWGIPNEGDKIKCGHMTPTFLGAEKWQCNLYVLGDQDKTKRGCTTHIFDGAQKWVEL